MQEDSLRIKMKTYKEAVVFMTDYVKERKELHLNIFEASEVLSGLYEKDLKETLNDIIEYRET